MDILAAKVISRRDRALRHIRPRTEKGLEIGPLLRPMVRRDDGDIMYVDHATTTELHEKYRSDLGDRVAEITPIDFVWGDRTLEQATNRQFDYCIASHVVEHVPDLIGWLAEISEVLVPGGKLSLVVPDRRFWMDYWRPESTVADAVEAWRDRRRRPAFRAIFDQHALCVDLNAVEGWAGRVPRPRPDQVEIARQHADRYVADGGYHDTHCWVFTPRSFLDLFTGVVQLGLTDFEVVSFESTPVNYQEFYVTLARLPQGLAEPAARARQLASLPSRLTGKDRHWLSPLYLAAYRFLEKHDGLMTKARSLRRRGWI